MNIRKTRPEDIDELLKIYAEARELMRRSGNPDQWRDSFPPDELVKSDVENGLSYAVEQGGAICGVFVFYIGKDPDYAVIENGAWLNDDPYGVVHRVASGGRGKGVLGAILAYCESRADNVRIDTHEDNKIMQHLLDKYGYTKCGTIYIDGVLPRIAYHKKVR